MSEHFAAAFVIVPQVIFSMRWRERCARHGCDANLFFEGLRQKGFDVEEVQLHGKCAQFAQTAEAVTQKSNQRLAILKARRVGLVGVAANATAIAAARPPVSPV